MTKTTYGLHLCGVLEKADLWIETGRPAGLGCLIDGCFLIRLTQLRFPHVGSCRNSGLTVPQRPCPFMECSQGWFLLESPRTQSVGIFKTPALCCPFRQTQSPTARVSSYIFPPVLNFSLSASGSWYHAGKLTLIPFLP